MTDDDMKPLLTILPSFYNRQTNTIGFPELEVTEREVHAYLDTIIENVEETYDTATLSLDEKWALLWERMPEDEQRYFYFIAYLLIQARTQTDEWLYEELKDMCDVPRDELIAIVHEQCSEKKRVNHAFYLIANHWMKKLLPGAQPVPDTDRQNR